MFVYGSIGARMTVFAATKSQSSLPEKEHILRKYSEFFQTLHDESTPTGLLGRGTHYSVFRAIVFVGAEGLSQARFHDFAVIWDEDHDERVMKAIEKVYFAGLLSNFLMFGERKGGFTAISGTSLQCPEPLARQLNDITSHLDGDSWLSSIAELEQTANPIIGDDDKKVSLYLKTVHMLWQLGTKLPIPSPPWP